MSSLNGARVAHLEGRMSGEMAKLIRHYGGEPVSAPSVREHALECGAEVAAFIDWLTGSSPPKVVIFLTGAGATALFREAEQLGRLPELFDALKEVQTVCRGPKPTAVLKRYGLPISLSVREPYTTTELLEALSTLDLTAHRIAVVHYGERNVMLAEALQSKGVQLEELCLYEWLMPEDTAPLQEIIHEIINQRIDAVVFTSQVQARHLLQVAASLGRESELIQALNASTVVAAVGPTCAASLESSGVTPQVVPEHPKMGPMLSLLAQHIEQRRGETKV